jgi:ribonuclease HI
VRHLTLLDWTIHFGWVKAHVGIAGNEMADTLAKQAAQEAMKALRESRGIDVLCF